MTQNKSEPQITKKQHYVPQFYLRNFADANENIYVYDRNRKSIFATGVSNICCKNWTYETEWKTAVPQIGTRVQENYIERAFVPKEAEYAELLRAILSRCQYANENTLIARANDKESLRDFAIHMYLRNPSTLNSVVAYYCDDNWKENEAIRPYLDCFEAIPLGDTESFFEHTMKTATLLNNGKGSPIEFLTDELRKLNPCFLQTKDAEFVTSSSPFIGITHNNESHSAYIPISPQTAILFSLSDILYPYRNRILTIDGKAVSDWNSLFLKTEISETRFILSKSKSTLESLVQEKLERGDKPCPTSNSSNPTRALLLLQK